MPSYNCDQCTLTFQTASTLKRHMRVHTRERPFECRICTKRFARSDALVRHMRTHTGEETHRCDVCSKGFNTKGNLTDHKRIHTRERPYPCEACGFAFTQSSNLKKHQKIHETGSLQCEICGCRFNRKINLSNHKLTKHPLASTTQFVTAHTHLEPVGIVSVTTQTTVSSSGNTTTISTVTSPIGSAYMVTERSSSATITRAIQVSGRVNTDTNQNFPGSDPENIYQYISPSELSRYDYDSDDSFDGIPS